MNTTEVLQRTPQKIAPSFSLQQQDFSGFKEGIWLPLIRNKMSSWKLYAMIYGKYLEEFLEEHTPLSLTMENVHAFVKRLKKKKLSSGAYNRVLSVLKHFLKTAYEHEFIDTDLSSRLSAYFLKAESKQDTCLDAEKIKLLFKKLTSSESRIARAIELLILTGASKSEILTARWEDYDCLNHLLTVKSRNGSKRTLRLGPQSIAILDSLPRTGQSPWIFPGRDKAKHLNDVFLVWDAIRKACGLDQIRIQDLKHNYKNWQKNNSGYSISIEEQLESQAEKKPCSTLHSGLLKPEIALIGVASAKYENTAGNSLSLQATAATDNTLLLSYLSNILKSGLLAVHAHNGKKPVLRGEKFLIDLAKRAIKNSALSKQELKNARCAVLLGLENQEVYSLNPYHGGLLPGLNGYCNNLAQSLTLALGFSCAGTEINSPGSSFLSALQTACLKIAFGDLDIALVGGTGACNVPFITEQIPEFLKEDYTIMAVLCSPAYAEKARLPLLFTFPLSELKKVCATYSEGNAMSESL